MWAAFYTVIPGPRSFHLVALPDSIFKFPTGFSSSDLSACKEKKQAKGLIGKAGQT